MIITKTKKWGNSLGVIIPSEEVKRLHLHADEEIVIEVVPKNPLREMFGFAKGKNTRKKFLDHRKSFESKLF